MPIDIVLGNISEDRPKHETYVDYVEDLRERPIESHQIAREHIGTAADACKTTDKISREETGRSSC